MAASVFRVPECACSGCSGSPAFSRFAAGRQQQVTNKQRCRCNQRAVWGGHEVVSYCSAAKAACISGCLAWPLLLLCVCVCVCVGFCLFLATGRGAGVGACVLVERHHHRMRCSSRMARYTSRYKAKLALSTKKTMHLSSKASRTSGSQCLFLDLGNGFIK